MKIEKSNKKKRFYGEHLTPIRIFREYILPEIKNDVYKYIWVDLFSGEGNLILPILELVPENFRVEFFKEHIFLFDIQAELVNRAIDKAVNYGIPREVAQKNICQRDTIKNYPTFLLNLQLPIFHITNPPYLYLGYIAKHPETKEYLEYFSGENQGYQDLYQLALINDLRYGIEKMVYIIPSNFLFGFSISNKIRNDFLQFYNIKKAIIFERKIFEHTGTNVIICWFERKKIPGKETIFFEGIKINDNAIQKRLYVLRPENKYRAGNEFEDFVNQYKATKCLNITYYLTSEEVEKNKGEFEIEVLDVNKYKKTVINVNEKLFHKIKSNILFVRTLDTGAPNGRAGLYVIRDTFDVDGILVSKEKYRTHPIQIFIYPPLSIEEQLLLKDYFNLLLEYFRARTDSEFMTTYKYSKSEYTRKYLGLSQAKNLIQTFPILNLKEDDKIRFKNLIKNMDIEELINFVKVKNKVGKSKLWD